MNLHEPAKPDRATTFLGSAESVGHARELVRRTFYEEDRKGTSGIPNALEFLDSHEEVARRRSLVIELALEEYCLRRERSEQFDLEGYCARFSKYGHSVACSIARQIEVEDAIAGDCHELEVPRSTPWPLPGDELGEFLVVEELGRGTFARVYLCIQHGLGKRQVALKIAHRGEFEAETMGRLSHPNIVPVFSVRSDAGSGTSYICMPFLGRSTFLDLVGIAGSRKRLRLRGPDILKSALQWNLPTDNWTESLDISQKLSKLSYLDSIVFLSCCVADALVHAHSLGVIHGDLKPSNILLAFDGAPMLLDFNLSHDIQFPTELMGGSLPYMSPEMIDAVILRQSPVGAVRGESSDIYSFAVILYELLCGQPPFPSMPNAESVIENARRQIEQQKLGPTPIRLLNPQVNRSLSDAIHECLAFSPSKRTSSMNKVLSKLREEQSRARRTQRYLRSHPRVAMSFCIAVSVIFVISLAFLFTRPSFSKRMLDRGTEHLAVQQYQKALGSFSSVSPDSPEAPEARFLRGRSLVGLQDYEMAIDEFQAASKMRSDWRCNAAIGYCCNMLHKHGEAAFWYQKVVDEGGESVAVLNNLAYSVAHASEMDIEDRRLESAGTLLDQVLRIDPTLLESRYNRAYVEDQKARLNKDYIPKKGLNDIRIVISNSQPSARAYFLAASLSLQASNFDRKAHKEASSYLANAIALSTSSERTEIRNDPVFKDILDQSRFVDVFRSPAPEVRSPRLRRVVAPF